jgi:hypothetical protein
MSRQADYISEARAANRQVWEGINTLKSLQREYNALDYGNTLPDGSGENEGISKAEVGAVIFDTANAMVSLLDTGHATNMAKLL